MKHKILAVLTSQQLKGLLSTAARIAARDNHENPIRFALNSDGSIAGQLLGINVEKIGAFGVIVSTADKRTSFIDAHFHPDNDLQLSPIDVKTMIDANLPGAIIFSDAGVHQHHENSSFNPLKPISMKRLHYAYCNISRVIGKSIQQILDINNDRISKITSKLQSSLDSVQNKLKAYCADDTDESDNNISMHIKNWIKKTYPDESDFYIENLRLNGHDISHIIENFIEENPEFSEYNTPEKIDALASKIYKRVCDDDYDSDTAEDFETGLFETIKESLKKGGDDSFISNLSTDLSEIEAEAKEINEKMNDDRATSGTGNGAGNDNNQNIQDNINPEGAL